MRTSIESLTAPAAPGNVDDWGNSAPASSVWGIKVPTVACWLYTQTEREQIGPNDTKVVEQLRVLMPKGTDVRETDRLNGVTGRNGSIIRAGLLAIESVTSHHTHLELSVRGIA